MKVKANVLSIFTGSFKDDKNGQEKAYYQLNIIDTEQKSPEVIKLKLKENLIEAAQTVVGKTALLDVSFSAGKVTFDGITQKAA